MIVAALFVAGAACGDDDGDPGPTATIAKSKHGFGMPFGLWLRSHAPLSDLVHGSLDAFQRRGILRPSYLQDLRRQHHAEHATYFGIMIWVVALLECWLGARNL